MMDKKERVLSNVGRATKNLMVPLDACKNDRTDDLNLK
jgi:hypothetical protein